MDSPGILWIWNDRSMIDPYGGLQKPQALSNGFSRRHVIFFSSYRFSKRWLHTLIKEFTWARKGKRWKRKRNSNEVYLVAGRVSHVPIPSFEGPLDSQRHCIQRDVGPGPRPEDAARAASPKSWDINGMIQWIRQSPYAVGSIAGWWF